MTTRPNHDAVYLCHQFSSTSDEIVYEFHFPSTPQFLELRDIHGRGLRFGNR